MRTTVQGDANTRFFGPRLDAGRVCEIFPKRRLRYGPPKTYGQEYPWIEGRFRSRNALTQTPCLGEELECFRAGREIVLREPCGVEQPRHVAAAAVAQDRGDHRAFRQSEGDAGRRGDVQSGG